MASSFTSSLDHTQRRITVCRTPLGEWSARRRDLYLTTHNTHNRQPCPRRDSNPHSQQASGRRPTTHHFRIYSSIPHFSPIYKFKLHHARCL